MWFKILPAGTPKSQRLTGTLAAIPTTLHNIRRKSCPKSSTRAHDQVRQSLLSVAFWGFKCLRIGIHRGFEGRMSHGPSTLWCRILRGQRSLLLLCCRQFLGRLYLRVVVIQAYLGLVSAARFFREHISGHGVSAGSRSAADLAELTLAALALQVGTVAQTAQQRRITVNRGQGLLTNISGRDR
jgi:hypothetical protein